MHLKSAPDDDHDQDCDSNVDYDERDDKLYRRPPTYLIIASKIVRPSTVYKVVVNLLEEAKPMRVRAALSRDGIEVYGDSVNMNPQESQEILLQVPPGNNVDSDYRLRVEGGHQAGHGGGAIVFENETKPYHTPIFKHHILGCWCCGTSMPSCRCILT